MNKPVISIQNLGKRYNIGERQPYYSFRETIVKILGKLFSKAKHKNDEFWALENISFDINEGEVVGIIGRNGAGKSTLLKILSRITPPTSGKIILRGRVASLLEVGTGFHQELTGRENIYLNGSILGMNRKEIDHKFAKIVAFSGVDKFLDTPVKHYSSGMRVRLAFAVAAHLDPEILIIDEVLSVGDSEFQKKCLGKMEEVSRTGRTIIFVSHDMSVIRRLCNRVIILESGHFIFDGDVEIGISKYTNRHKIEAQSITFPENLETKAQINSISLISAAGPDGSYDLSRQITFKIKLTIRDNNLKVYCGITILNQFDEKIIFSRDIEIVKKLQSGLEAGQYQYLLSIPKNSLSPGEYRLKFDLMDLNFKTRIHQPDRDLSFNISDNFSERKKIGLPWRGITAIQPLLKVTKIT